MMVSGIAFHPDVRYLISAGPDGALRIDILDPGELIAIARTRVMRSLSVEESQKYLHVDTCPVE